MTKTKQDFITELKAEYPTLTKGIDDEVIALSSDEYSATIDEWADDRLVMQSKEANELQAIANKAAATAKLEALGLTTDDLKALGLGTN